MIQETDKENKRKIVQERDKEKKKFSAKGKRN